MSSEEPKGRRCFYFYFLCYQVLHFHIILGLQDLLRLRIHVARRHHSGYRYNLCHHRLHLFPPKCRGLSVVSGFQFCQATGNAGSIKTISHRACCQNPPIVFSVGFWSVDDHTHNICALCHKKPTKIHLCLTSANVDRF